MFYKLGFQDVLLVDQQVLKEGREDVTTATQ
jgi:hypothetical protein